MNPPSPWNLSPQKNHTHTTTLKIHIALQLYSKTSPNFKTHHLNPWKPPHRESTTTYTLSFFTTISPLLPYLQQFLLKSFILEKQNPWKRMPKTGLSNPLNVSTSSSYFSLLFHSLIYILYWTQTGKKLQMLNLMPLWLTVHGNLFQNLNGSILWGVYGSFITNYMQMVPFHATKQELKKMEEFCSIVWIIVRLLVWLSTQTPFLLFST